MPHQYTGKKGILPPATVNSRLDAIDSQIEELKVLLREGTLARAELIEKNAVKDDE